MPNILRIYSIASFLSILAIAGLMALLYRTVTIHSVVTLAEHSNLVIAQSALQPIRAELVFYLLATSDINRKSSEPLPIPRALDAAISELTRNSRITRLIIYNQHGVISASTGPPEIGTTEAQKPGFVAAMQGKIWTNLAYRDAFNVFRRPIDDENLVESYIPVRGDPSAPVVGVFEVYTDVSETIRQAERAQLTFFAVTVVLLVILYAALMMTLRRAHKVINEQQQMILEKTDALKSLSEKSLRREEVERKKLSGALHEDLAQTLSAIKLAVETGEGASIARPTESAVGVEVVPGLQSAIRQVRDIAMDLRPPSLDDLGLIPTIRAMCGQFSELHPSIEVEQDIAVMEETIPTRLKIVVYRNIESGFKIVGQRRGMKKVTISLQTENRSLILVIEGDGTAEVPSPGLSELGAESHSPLSAFRERTIISGGELEIRNSQTGHVTLRASWHL